MVAFLDKTLDSSYERFAATKKELQEALEVALKDARELEEALIEENEKKFGALCDEALEMEEKLGADGWKCEDVKRLQALPGKLCFSKFGDSFLEWLFTKLFIFTSF